MKQLLLVCVTVASLLFSNNAQSQVKIGHFDEQSLLSLFPGLEQTMDSVMNTYLRDSLNVEYAYSVQDYKRRDSIYKKDSATMPAKAREMAESDLNRLYYKIANWQQYSQEMQQDKMERLLLPYRQQMFNALQQVVAEQKYTWVFKSEALLTQYVQPSILDNLTIRVALKLNLPLSKEIMDAWKAAGGPVPAAATGAKPTTTAPKKN
ncbi:MAG: OmpH family outer membrane protein [Chitinophagaceae bacterium]|nr:OmpH family outer membrane protein [Chitinophagaceae bacterium]